MNKLVLLSTLVILSSCQPEPSVEEQTLPTDQPLDPTLFAPKIGHTWIYRQTSRQIQAKAQLPIQGEDMRKKTSQRIQRYEGPLEIEDQTFHHFTITHDAISSPDLLLGYQQDTLVIVAQSKPDGTFVTDQQRIPIAQKGMRVGTFWRWPPDSEGTSGFRIVSLEEVSVPAGTFEAYKVTYQGNQGDILSLKDYWFTPCVGIIREESRSYQSGLLRAQSVIELEKMISPEPAPLNP